jgi:hypothetical protein
MDALNLFLAIGVVFALLAFVTKNKTHNVMLGTSAVFFGGAGLIAVKLEYLLIVYFPAVLLVLLVNYIWKLRGK